MVTLFPHQVEGLKQTEGLESCALYWDMGLGKTFGGSEKMMQYGNRVNLVVCQKSKVEDWVNHFKEHYDDVIVYNGTKAECLKRFFDYPYNEKQVCIINYDLIFRRPELASLKDFTLMLDESSLIQNEMSKRSKFILKKLNPKNVILLSGTPTGGKYERLWSQCRLLGWKISKDAFWKTYVKYHFDTRNGFPLKIIDGYKNVDRLKRKLREYGAVFMKTEEVFDLPAQIDTTIQISSSKEYRKFRRNAIVSVNNVELVGDTTLTKMLYERQLCGQYNAEKFQAFRDLLESTDDRLIVFYNFTAEMKELHKIAFEEYERPCSLINGSIKNLEAYENCDDSVTLIQYQAGSMGLNLQKANKIIYFTPPLSSELFEQSKKRIHRIGQNKPCFYYYIVCSKSVEENIYATLKMRKDYTEVLFEGDNH